MKQRQGMHGKQIGNKCKNNMANKYMASRQKMQSMVMHVKQKRKYRQGIHDKHIGNRNTWETKRKQIHR